MKGLFIPGITAEMFRNGCLESIEALMAEGEIYDIDYEPEPRWIPCSERLPKENGRYLTTNSSWGSFEVDWNAWINGEWLYPSGEPVAWMPLPEPYERRD